MSESVAAFSPTEAAIDWARLGHVYVVGNGKGGVGKSVFAANLAHAFIKEMKAKAEKRKGEKRKRSQNPKAYSILEDGLVWRVPSPKRLKKNPTLAPYD